MSRRMLLGSNLMGVRESTEDRPVANSVDVMWLLHHPSTLLWAEPLYMTGSDFEGADYLAGLDHDNEREAVRLLFDGFRDAGIIEIIDPKELLTDGILEYISEQVEYDKQQYGGCQDCGEETADGRRDPANIEVGGQRYCPVIIRGIYGTLLASRFVDATSLLDPLRLSFCRARFSEMEGRRDVGHEVQAINSVYEVCMPDVIASGDYRLFCAAREECAHNAGCLGDVKANTLRLIDDVLRLRDSKEMRSLAKYVDAKLPECGYDESRLLAAMRSDLRRMQSKVLSLVPKLERVSRVTLYASLPAYAAAVVGKPGLLTVAPPALVAVSRAAGAYAEKMTQQYRWTAALSENLNYDALAKHLKE